MIQKKINLFLGSFTKHDILYFLYSFLFYEIFFKVTRRYYYVFENTLEYYFSFFSKSFFFTSYSFLILALIISSSSVFLKKLINVNYFFSNIISFLFVIYVFKIFGFPRSNFLYLLILFPLGFLIISKLNLNYLIKFTILVIPVIISASTQSYYFEARQASFLTNIAAEDIDYKIISFQQERDQLYNNPDKIQEFRKISFDDEVLIKEFVICCENIKSTATKGKPIGYIEKHENNLIYISGTGDLFFMNIENLINESISNFQKINTNFRDLVKNQYIYTVDERFSWGGWESVKNIFYDNGYLYVSYIDETEDDCATLSIIKGKVDLATIEFIKLFTLDDCIPRTNNNYTGIQSGGAITNYNDENLIFTTGDFRQRTLPQDKNSQYGKTLKINKNNGSYEILSLGHRNPQGIKKIREDLFIATEHGPRMGDEINIIDTSSVNNYGWPIASYGLHYASNFGINFIFEELKDAPLYKSHTEYGFTEPIYYFGFDKTVEHGISDIEIIFNDNENLEFMFGSLYYRRLYIASYDITNYKFQSLTSYNLGNRVRDILKIDDKTYIGLLEDPPRISIITTNNN